MNPSGQEPGNVNPIADQNTERLLAGAYRPETPDPAFVARVTAAMQAKSLKSSRPAPVSQSRSMLTRWIGWTAAAGLLLALGAVAGAVLRAHLDVDAARKEQFARMREAASQFKIGLDGGTNGSNVQPTAATAMAQQAAGTATVPPAIGTVALQTAASRSVALPPAETLQVGQSAETAGDQRRRLALADGSILYLNRDTAVTLTAAREVALRRGEIYVEVAQDPAAARFIVSTPRKQMIALGTKFDVRVAPEGTQLQVTQGKVEVSDLQLPVLAGQQLMLDGPAEGPPDISPAPRATHTIEWTRDLMSAAHSPLVPASKYSGGRLVAVDSQGQETYLSLRKYHVDVHIEDGFARTTIDQTYFNQASSRLEGTFYFPLPPDASLSRLAMYVNGRLMEGGMAERQHARQVFNSIVARMKDPALLEWVDGSTFKMRVFPLEGRQEKRIILSYTQRLPSLYGRSEYRFPGGHSLPAIGDWSAHVCIKRGAGGEQGPGSGERGVGWEPQFTATTVGDDLLLDAAAKNIRPDRDIIVRIGEPISNLKSQISDLKSAGGTKNANSPHPNPLPEGEGTSASSPHPNPLPEGEGTAPLPAPRFSSAVSEGSKYLMLRWRPELPGETKRQRRDWILLFESSADRDPLLARTQIEIVKTILDNAEHDDTYSILTAATRVQAYQAKPQAATPANVKAAVQFLESVHLVGALDLGRAFDAARPLAEAAGNPVLVHVGSGLPVLGQRDPEALVKRLPQRAAYVGVAVGNRWSRALMKSAAARSGGYFTQINPNEQIVWRALDLLATINTPRLLDIRVSCRVGQDPGHPRSGSASAGPPSGGPALAGSDTQAVVRVPRELVPPYELQFLTCEESLAQGEQLCAIARLDAADAMPKAVEITGQLNGKPQKWTIPVSGVAEQAGYLPRTWAKLEIDRLVAGGAEKNKDRIVELSKAMYVMSPFTSLLVLENEEMYAQYQVDRGRKDHWAMYACPQQIPVVNEPLVGPPSPRVKTEAKGPTAEEVLSSVLVRVPPAMLRSTGARSPNSDFTKPMFAPPGGAWNSGIGNGSPDAVGVYYLENAMSSAVAEDLSRILSADMADSGSPFENRALTTGPVKIIPDTRLNALIVVANHTDQNTVERFVKTLDLREGPKAAAPRPSGQSLGDRQLELFPLQRFDPLLDMQVVDAINRFFSSPDPEQPWTTPPTVSFDAATRLLIIRGTENQIAKIKELLTPMGEPSDAGGNAREMETANSGPQRDQEKIDRLMSRFDTLLPEARSHIAEESAIRVETGFVDNQPMIYPNAAVWKALTARRHEIYGWNKVYPVADLVLPIRNAGALPGGHSRIVNPVQMEDLPDLDVVILKGGEADVQQMVDFLWHIEGAPSNDPPITYPDAETWKALTARRKETYSSQDLAKVSSAEEKITNALKQPTEFEFVDTPLRDVVDYLKDLHHIEIQLDGPGLKEAGVEESTPITKNFHGISLRSALRLLLDELQLKYVIRNEVLLITSPERAEAEEMLGYRPDAAAMLRWVLPGYDREVRGYEAPVFSNDPAVFSDLLSYAPAMRANLADVLAVLEAEVPSDAKAAQPGKIDDRARQLIERARGAGWQTATLAGPQSKAPLTIAFDGTGRYRYEQTTSAGLREQVLCDGTSLWHLYPELGIGARRTLSRFQRGDFARLVPWALPPAEELARNADLVCIDERTVAIVPHDKLPSPAGRGAGGEGSLRAHLVFAPDGRLAERELVEMPAGKILARESYAADGTVTFVADEAKKAGGTPTPQKKDASETPVPQRKIQLAPCGAPELKPDAALVVLPLPLRSRQQVVGARKQLPDPDETYDRWSEEDALAVIAADLGDAPTELRQIIGQRFFRRGDRRLGFYTLLLSSGQTWNPKEKQAFQTGDPLLLDPLADHPHEPAAKYMAAYLTAVGNALRGVPQGNFISDPDEKPATPPRNATEARNATEGVPYSRDEDPAAGDGNFFRQLAEFHDLWNRWHDGRANLSDPSQRREEQQRALAFIERAHSPELAWGLLMEIRWAVLDGGECRDKWAAAIQRLETVPGLHYAARYERAWALMFASGKEARDLFRKLFTETLEAGVVPPIDVSFRDALLQGGDAGQWAATIRAAAKTLIDAGARPSAVYLARQVQQARDPALAEEVFDMALGDAPESRRFGLTLARIVYDWHTGQFSRADARLQSLLADKRYAGWPALWYLAEAIADARGMTARALGFRQKAMELEFADLPEKVNLELIRDDYGQLLFRYEKLATAIGPLCEPPPQDLLAAVIGAADRWRQIDSDPTAACHAAARILGQLGETDLAWDYLTTPLCVQPYEAAGWVSLAQALRQQGQIDLADRAYAAAFDAEPANAQVLWDRAAMLQEDGRTEQARPLFRQIAAGSWGPQFAGLQEKAKQQVGK